MNSDETRIGSRSCPPRFRFSLRLHWQPLLVPSLLAVTTVRYSLTTLTAWLNSHDGESDSAVSADWQSVSGSCHSAGSASCHDTHASRMPVSRHRMRGCSSADCRINSSAGCTAVAVIPGNHQSHSSAGTELGRHGRKPQW